MLIHGGKDIEKLLSVVGKLTKGQRLDSSYNDHMLKGKYKGKRDCHLEPDLILLYALEDEELVLYRTGSHSHLFG